MVEVSYARHKIDRQVGVLILDVKGFPVMRSSKKATP
jgi:hypothetical protein